MLVIMHLFLSSHLSANAKLPYKQASASVYTRRPTLSWQHTHLLQIVLSVRCTCSEDLWARWIIMGVGLTSERSGVRFPNGSWVKFLSKFPILHCIILWPISSNRYAVERKHEQNCSMAVAGENCAAFFPGRWDRVGVSSNLGWWGEF
jgi:hypothetical protein